MSQNSMSEKDSALIKASFARIENEITLAMEGACQERQSQIQFRLSGPYSNLAYIYDGHTRTSLTQWVELSENAAKVHNAHHVLRERLADLYVQSLPFHEISEMVAKLQGKGETITWATEKSHLLFIDLADESNAELLASIEELALNEVKISYFPEFSATIVLPSSNLPELIRTAVDDMMREWLQGFLTTKAAQIAFAGASTFFMPAFLGLFRVIFRSLGVATRPSVEAQVNNVLQGLLTQLEIREIADQLNTCFHRYEERFHTVRISGNIGSPEAWETLVAQTTVLEERLLTPTANRMIEYQTHQLLSEAMVIRMHALLGMIESRSRAAQPINREVGHLNTMLNRWHCYLVRLLDQSYRRTRGQRDLLRVTPGVTSYVRDTFLPTPVPRQQVSYNVGPHAHVYNSRRGLEGRIDFFVTLNTGLHNLCKGYDDAVTILTNPQLGLGLWPNHRNVTNQIFINDFINHRYLPRAGNFRRDSQSHGNWPNANTWWYLQLFTFHELSRNNGASSTDYAIRLLTQPNLLLSVGDYPDLALFPQIGSQGFNGNIALPAGLVAVVFEGKGFEGRSAAIPTDRNTQARWSANHPTGMTVQSIKVRIDVGNRWYAANRPAASLGRLRTYFNWNNPGSTSRISPLP